MPPKLRCCLVCLGYGFIHIAHNHLVPSIKRQQTLEHQHRKWNPEHGRLQYSWRCGGRPSCAWTRCCGTWGLRRRTPTATRASLPGPPGPYAPVSGQGLASMQRARTLVWQGTATLRHGWRRFGTSSCCSRLLGITKGMIFLTLCEAGCRLAAMPGRLLTNCYMHQVSSSQRHRTTRRWQPPQGWHSTAPTQHCTWR